MSQKDVKNSLKSAKECMDSKDYMTAIQHCRNALKIDRNNYMALIFFGACLQETDQFAEAPKAFKKASQISPDQLLAWKGLATFCEKHNREGDREDLLNAYKNLLRLENDEAKIEEWVRKIGVLLSLLNEETILTAWDYILELPDKKQESAKRMLLTVIANADGDTPSYLPIIESLLKHHTWGDEKRQSCINLYKKYLKLLYKAKDLIKLLKESKTMNELYPTVFAGPEWFCKAYLEAKFEPENCEELLGIPEPSEMYMILLKLVPNSYLGFTCKGVDELACNEFIVACESLTQAVVLKPTYGIAWYLLTQAQIWLHRFSDAAQSARKTLEHWKPNNRNLCNLTNCKFWLSKSLCELDNPDHWKESIRIADEFIFDNPNNVDFLPVLIKASIKLEDTEKYEKYMSLLKADSKINGDVSLMESIWLKQNGFNEKSFEILKSAAEGILDNWEIWLQLGILQYESKEASYALTSLLKATKLNQWCHVNYLYLGHCYKNYLGDLTKARRCYQKAFQLNPSDSEAGISLSDVYRLQGMEDENMKLLTMATEVLGARWAWLKLGLHYLSVNQPLEAVSSLRVAMRLNTADKNVWESLGDAYLAIGSYTAAEKSYRKVLEANPDDIYPLLQIAVVKHLLELNEESVKDFQQVLKLKPNFLPALKGHATSSLALMRKHLKDNLNGLAADSCQMAITSLTLALEEKKDLICGWKLLADACILINKLPPKYCRIKVKQWLWPKGENLQDAEELLELSSLDIYQLGIRSMCHAISLSSKQASLWYDLAICYNHLANATSKTDDKRASRELAMSAVKQSLNLKQDNWISWNLLGVICISAEMTNYALAQHAFLKAIEIDPENAVLWTNIGSLYLILKDLTHANRCFTEAQRYDPNYIESWIGQAMIAESTEHHEATDLYRHSTQLGFHPEGALGYASLILSKLITTVDKSDPDYVFSIKNMNAVVTACDAMSWYADRFPDNVCAFNMLGLLMERQRLFCQSARAFDSAVQLFKSKKDTYESEPDKLDQLLLNYGRVLLKLGSIEESIAILKQSKKASHANNCTLASAYLLNNQLGEAYNTYESTLEWLAPDDEQKSHILVAMAAVLYVHQGHKDAKLLLMQACQLKPVSTAGLFACCGLGLLHSDLALTELALKELQQYRDDERYLAIIAQFEAFILLLKGEDKEAVRTLTKVAHRHPGDPNIWLNLGLLQLQLHPSCNSQAAANCFHLAHFLGRSSIDVSKVTSLIGLSHLLAGSGRLSLQYSVRAVKFFPEVVENWVVLIAAVLGRVCHQPTSRDLIWLKKTITHVRRRLEASKPITQWLSNCERKVNLLVSETNG